MRCAGKAAIVTGAAGQGMGRSIALTLAREGASVVVNYRTSAESADEIVRHIVERGGSAIACQADVTDRDGCVRLVDEATKAFGRVDICVVNAGAGWHPEPIEQLDATVALDDVIGEVAPLYHLLPMILPGMFERGWGRIVGIGLRLDKPSPAYAYNAAKAARNQVLMLAQDEAWAHGVTVNAICPGPVEAIVGLAQAVELCDHGVGWVSRNNVTPQDIAEGVAVLCSDAGRFINGSELTYAFN